MKKIHFKGAAVTLALLLVFCALSPAHGQPVRAASPPPIAPSLVREGDFAVKLAVVFLGLAADEVTAESRLADVGIIPRNGWIADYPVTPDVMGELQRAVADAAASGRLGMTKDEAQARFAGASADLELSEIPYMAGTGPAIVEYSQDYPNPTELTEYYVDEGPPVYTYYSPPADYASLYGFVPYPFVWLGYRFPGFFVLRDFHRHVHFHGRPVLCSNHFRDVQGQKVFRVDPVVRYKGKTFAGIGAPRTGNFIRTGVARSDVKVFNPPQARTAQPQAVQPGQPGRVQTAPTFPPPTATGTAMPPGHQGGFSTFPPPGATGFGTVPSMGGTSGAPNGQGGGRTGGPGGAKGGGGRGGGGGGPGGGGGGGGGGHR